MDERKGKTVCTKQSKTKREKASIDRNPDKIF